jgi:hypothetical protein
MVSEAERPAKPLAAVQTARFETHRLDVEFVSVGPVCFGGGGRVYCLDLAAGAGEPAKRS